MNEKQEKQWWQSKTIWLNLAVGALAAIDMSTDTLKTVLPPDVMGGILAVTAVANVVLRTITGQPVVVKKKK